MKKSILFTLFLCSCAKGEFEIDLIKEKDGKEELEFKAGIESR